MSHRRDVTRAVPRRAYAEKFAVRRQLARQAQAPDIRDMHPDKVDQAVTDERHVLGLIDEELPHGEGRRSLLPQDAEVLDVLRRERVLQEEQTVRLQFLRQPDSLDGRNTLMYVVQQLDLFAKRV